MSFRPAPPSSEDRAHLALFAGLCSSCAHAQLLRSRRSAFLRCALADEDGAYARYPPLPVTACSGHRAAGEKSPTGGGR